MMTGLPFSSMPSVSIRPPCTLPVPYSDARKRTPSSASRWRSISVWRVFSTATDCPGNAWALPSPMRKSLMSLMGGLLVADVNLAGNGGGDERRTVLLELVDVLADFGYEGVKLVSCSVEI